MFCNGFEVWLEVDGKRMTEHKPTVPELSIPGLFKTTCHVLKETGKNFRIWGQNHMEPSSSKGPKRQVVTVIINIDQVCKIYEEDSDRQTEWRWKTGAEIMSSKSPGETPGFAFETGDSSHSSLTTVGKARDRSITISIQPEVSKRIYPDVNEWRAGEGETGKDEYGRPYKEIWRPDGDKRNFTFYPASFLHLQQTGILPSTQVVYAENQVLKVRHRTFPHLSSLIAHLLLFQEEKLTVEKQKDRLISHNQALEDSLKQTNKLMETLLEDKETLLKENAVLSQDKETLMNDARKVLAEVATLRSKEDNTPLSEIAASADPRKRRRS
ncbi:hypothetical protein CALVIDRAFT_535801 [Calocera viscosa TUFC12733]|uniref:Uncharacterized protein n=1 Tax=Calocera viscosa (strain TUFC12733) TaxID=1330018 RepID=A0A167NH04_CALVF|nr:hypothetical protein CALVIDRAFT_535801 [Calocera viscosa TUFC12733]